MNNKVSSQMKKGILEYAILSIISRWEVYASDIISTLQQHDLIVVEGTLYPLLSRLKSDGLLNYSWIESAQWPPRKYYTLTDKWINILQDMRDWRNHLVDTINDIDNYRWK